MGNVFIGMDLNMKRSLLWISLLSYVYCSLYVMFNPHPAFSLSLPTSLSLSDFSGTADS